MVKGSKYFLHANFPPGSLISDFINYVFRTRLFIEQANQKFYALFRLNNSKIKCGFRCGKHKFSKKKRKIKNFLLCLK